MFPEEAEEALKTHPDVEDALGLGVSDERLGQMVTAVVALRGENASKEGELVGYVRSLLAAYKAPRRIDPPTRGSP